MPTDSHPMKTHPAPQGADGTKAHGSDDSRLTVVGPGMPDLSDAPGLQATLGPDAALLPSRASATYRLLTYNVHHCVGLDRRHAPDRIARVISQFNPHLVALQEIETRNPRNGHVDQAKVISDILQTEFHYHPARQRGVVNFGNAIFSRLPMRKIRSAILPGLPRLRVQSRGALWVSIAIEGVDLQIINTHLGLFPQERFLQAGSLVGREWLAHPECHQQPRILCGDFNATSASRVYRLFMDSLRDVQGENGKKPASTWPSFFPIVRYDHVFVDPQIKVCRVMVPRTPLTSLASDHLPLVLDFQILKKSPVKTVPDGSMK
jgi:endonuclease/exonuclease/phosphatase family metal-dependent hydrolase